MGHNYLCVVMAENGRDYSGCPQVLHACGTQEPYGNTLCRTRMRLASSPCVQTTFRHTPTANAEG